MKEVSSRLESVSTRSLAENASWIDAVYAASLFSVDPAGTGGVMLRAHAGPVRDHWLALMRELLPAFAPVRRLPLYVTDGRLLGGLDLAATLRAGRPIAERGILGEADGGVLLLAMAERVNLSTAARIAAVLDSGEVALARDGVSLTSPARFGIVALDEGITAEERPPSALFDRLAFHLDLCALRLRDAVGPVHSRAEIAAARLLLPGVEASPEILEALCATGMVLGIASIRAAMLALRVARAAAALAGRNTVTEEDAALAGRLVLAARATTMPAAEDLPQDEGADSPPDENPEQESAADSPDQRDRGKDESSDDAEGRTNQSLDDVVLAATQAAIPAGVLAQLKAGGEGMSRACSSGKAGALQQSGLRGRPAGVRRGEPRAGARLNIVETLRAAIPWQQLRRRGVSNSGAKTVHPVRIEVRREDFHVTRYKQRAETTTIFVVDASGSSALHRLAEAKGAVELLLADCYVRRDRVAVIAFRGRSAELLLPPTRSLVRAKRSLAGLPGGGSTPLAAAIDAAVALADAVRRRGETPTIVLLTDGRANISRDGSPGRERAEAETLAAARSVRAQRFTTLLVDTSPRPQPAARILATTMSATYLPLPYADAAALSRAVLAATNSSESRSSPAA